MEEEGKKVITVLKPTLKRGLMSLLEQANKDGVRAWKKIKSAVWRGQVDGEMLEVMINSRHQDALLRAKVATQTTAEAIKNDLTLELVALDLRIAVNAIGEIVGKTTTDDLLDKIFSEFCLGK